MSDLDPSLLLERIRAQIGGTYYGASFTDSLLTDCANVISALSQELKAAREEREKLLGRHDYDGESWPYSKCKLCGADGMDWRHVPGHISRVAAAALTEPEETK